MMEKEVEAISALIVVVIAFFAINAIHVVLLFQLRDKLILDN